VQVTAYQTTPGERERERERERESEGVAVGGFWWSEKEKVRVEGGIGWRGSR
jgi:hypothetical protein